MSGWKIVDALEGTETSPARPSDIGSVKMQKLECLQVETWIKGGPARFRIFGEW
jgi:hypothetical protein